MPEHVAAEYCDSVAKLSLSFHCEALLSAPAWRREELDDGAVLVVSTPNPRGDGETAAIDEHLGIERPTVLDEHLY